MTSIRNLIGLAARVAPSAAPPITTNSDGCTKTPSGPLIIKKPPITQTKTTTMPIIINMILECAGWKIAAGKIAAGKSPLEKKSTEGLKSQLKPSVVSLKQVSHLVFIPILLVEFFNPAVHIGRKQKNFRLSVKDPEKFDLVS